MKQLTNKIEWREEKLGAVCDVRDGTHASPKYVQEGYPLITSKNLTRGFIDFSEINLISKSDFEEINKRSKVDAGDIIMPMIGTIGNPVIVPNKIREFAIKNVALIKLKELNISNIYIKFILNSPYFEKVTAKYNRGGTQKFIALGDIRNIPIPIPFSNGKPDLKEQERIVSILEKAEKLKEKGKNAEELLDEYLKSVFNEMFYNKGFEEIEFIKSLEKEASNNKLKLKGSEFLKEGKFPIIDQGEDFIAGYTNDKSKVYNERLPIIVFGDHTRILKFIDFPFALGADGVKILVPRKDFNPYYFYYCLKSIDIKSAGYSRHYKFLKEKKVPLPPLPLQKKFAKIVEQVEKMKVNVKKTKQSSEELFNSLMQKAFRGEL